MATEAVVKKIAREFRGNINGSTTIRGLQKKLRNGTATYSDANKYAMGASKALNKALADNLVDDALSTADYRLIIATALPDGLKAAFSTVSEYTKGVQTILNKKANINLKPVVSKIDAGAIVTITGNAAAATSYSEAAGAVAHDTMDFTQNITARMMKDNAGFQQNVGYEVKVVRIYDDIGLRNRTQPCQFCEEREGEWDYNTALELGVFARHPGCGCTIIYNAEKGPQLQTRWENNVWEDL